MQNKKLTHQYVGNHKGINIYLRVYDLAFDYNSFAARFNIYWQHWIDPLRLAAINSGTYSDDELIEIAKGLIDEAEASRLHLPRVQSAV